MKPDDEVIRITIDEAVAAARAAAFTESFDEDDDRGREPRTLIHSFTTGSMMLGADWDLDAVIAFIERSQERAWVFSLVRHELAVAADGRLIVFDVQRDQHAVVSS